MEAKACEWSIKAKHVRVLVKNKQTNKKGREETGRTEVITGVGNSVFIHREAHGKKKICSRSDRLQ